MFNNKITDTKYNGDMSDVIIKAALDKVGVENNEVNYEIAIKYIADIGNVHPNVAFTELVEKLLTK